MSWLAAYALDLHRLAVQEQSFVLIDRDGADAELHCHAVDGSCRLTL